MDLLACCILLDVGVFLAARLSLRMDVKARCWQCEGWECGAIEKEMLIFAVARKQLKKSMQYAILIYIYTQCIWHVENLDFDKVHQIFLNPTHTHNSMQCKLLDWNHQTPQLHSACIQSHTRSNRNLAEIGSQRWHGLLGKARSIWGLRAVILAVKTCLGSLDKLISLEAPGIVILDDVFLSKALP